MVNFKLLAKAFIIDRQGRLLLVRRDPDEFSGSQYWDLPGGELSPGENPLEGLEREVKNELDVKVNVTMPLDVQHISHVGGQNLTTLIFLVEPQAALKLNKISLDYKWVIVDENNAELPSWLNTSVKKYSLTRFDKIVNYIDSEDQSG